MDRTQLVEQIKEVRKLADEIHKKINQLEAMYIGDLYKSCPHVFDTKWVEYDSTTEANYCSICSIKVKRPKGGQ